MQVRFLLGVPKFNTKEGENMSSSLEEFRDDFDGAPLELKDFAEGAIEIEDCDDLASKAQAFLDAKEEFESALESHGIEVG